MIAATTSGHPGVDRWNSLYNSIAPRYGVPPNLLKAHVLYESGGDPNIVGSIPPPGCGLAQITSGVNQSNGEFLYEGANILDPAFNLTVACKNFIKPNIEAFPNNIDAVVAAFNAGISAVQQALSEGRDPSTATYGAWYVPAVTGAYTWFCEQSHRAKS
jgi:soluble lytic murein transglycosylase-like protein